MKVWPHVLMVLMLGVLTTGCFTNPHVPEGHEGYIYEKPRVWGKGGYLKSIQGPGNFGVSIWNNKAIQVDYRPKTYSEDFNILAKGDLIFEFKFHTLLKPKPNTVKDVVEKFGATDWYARSVKEALRTFIRDAVMKYDYKGVKDSIPKIEAEVKERLDLHFKDTPFVLISLHGGQIIYPKRMTDAIEAKLASEQELMEKEQRIQIAEKDAEIRIAEAKGIAQSQKIINATLTSSYLQFEAIQAQKAMAKSQNHTTVYIPTGTNGIPLVKTTN